MTMSEEGSVVRQAISNRIDQAISIWKTQSTKKYTTYLGNQVREYKLGLFGVLKLASPLSLRVEILTYAMLTLALHMLTLVC